MSNDIDAQFNDCSILRIERAEALLRQLTVIDRAKNTDEMRAAINSMLKIIGYYTGAGRVFIFDKINAETETYSNTYEWCAEGVEPQIDFLSALTEDDMPYWLEKFRKGDIIVIPDMEAVRSVMPCEYEILKKQDIDTEIAVPIFYHGHFSGFIGLDNPAIDKTELFIQLLTLVGTHLGSARENMRMLNLLEKKQMRLQKSIEDMEKERQVLTVLCEDNTSVFYVNLKTDTAETVKISNHANIFNIISPKHKRHLCYSKEMKAYYDKYVIKETAPDYMKILSPWNLMRELADKHRVSLRFQSYPNKMGQVYFEVRVTKMYVSETDFQVLVDFRHIDEIINEERQHRQKLEAALSEARMNNEIISAISKIYFLIYRIDLDDNYFEEISNDSQAHKLTGRKGAAMEEMARIGSYFPSEEYRQRVCQFLDLSTIASRLKKDESTAVEYLAADGSWHLARFIVQKRDGNGNASQLIYVVRFISEEKRRERYWIVAAEEANKANAAKSDFLSRMSHDIRTPMNVIMGFTNIALQHINEPEKLRNYLVKIQKSGFNLQQLIDNVLDISRIESGNMKLASQPVNISDLFDFYKQTMVSNDIEKHLSFDCVKHDIEHNILLGDRLRIGQIYSNLLSNAVKYTPDGGTVHFEVYEEKLPEADKVRLVSIVSDTGIGMTPEFMKDMYSEFSRAVDTRVNRVRGSGLGLSIVKKLVDLMGGTISVQSKVQQGTTFRIAFDLPFFPEEIAEIADEFEQKDDGAADIANKGVTVLIAEDNELNYEIVAEQLEMFSVKSVRAVNGAECVKIFSESAPGTFDAILMDMQMPVMNGVEAATAIRDLPMPQAKTIPIIAVTANAYQEDIQRCIAAGMNSHISKPINIKDVIRMIYGYLNK